MLVDTGIATTPEETISPFFGKVRLKPQQLTLAVTTHADLNHQGGNNDDIKRISAGTLLGCGEADRELVENPGALYGQRYNFLKEDHEMGLESEPSPDAGRDRRMDFSFPGGEEIYLGNEWWLEVLQ